MRGKIAKKLRVMAVQMGNPNKRERVRGNAFKNQTTLRYTPDSIRSVYNYLKGAYRRGLVRV